MASVGTTAGGAVSSSTMVAVPVAREMVAPEALVSTTVKCSLASPIRSAVIGDRDRLALLAGGEGHRCRCGR